MIVLTFLSVSKHIICSKHNICSNTTAVERSYNRRDDENPQRTSIFRLEPGRGSFLFSRQFQPGNILIDVLKFQ